MDAPDIAIIGGGIAGLVAAAHIASVGGRPVVFEAAPQFGGRARTRIVDGYCLNQGPHALYLAGAFHGALRDYGVPVAGGGPDLRNGLAMWAGRPNRFPIQADDRPIPPLGDDAAAALRAFLGRVATDSTLGRGLALADTFDGLPPMARAVVQALVRLSTYVDAPADMDGKAALDQLRLSFAGTIYVDGGWGALVDGLVDVSTKAGAVLRPGERVSRVQSEKGGILIELRGGRIERFAAAILAVPPRTAVMLVDGSAELRAISTDARPVRLTSLDLALSNVPRDGADFVLGMDSPTYLSVHSAAAKLAPPGGAMVHLARYLAPEERSSPDHLEELRHIADTLHPGWRDRVVHEQRITGAVVAYDFPRHAIGGRRASHILGDTPGVFMAGDWVGDTGLLADAAAASARAAADEALAHSRRLSIHAPTRRHRA